jgi:4-hydroxy-4-methyl-2-oxoglutarate aldolase
MIIAISVTLLITKPIPATIICKEEKNGPGTVGAEISIGGGIIRSGDLIVADRDGVTVLPQGKIPAALEGLKAVRARERKIEDRIAAGMTMPDWVEEFLAGDRVAYIE